MRQEFRMMHNVYCMRSLSMVQWVRKLCRTLNKDGPDGAQKQYDIANDLQVINGAFFILVCKDVARLPSN